MKTTKLLLLLIFVPAYQNCSAPQADAVPTAIIVGPSSANLASSGLPAGVTLPSNGANAVALAATYSPSPLLTSQTATITVSNGTGPYTYTLVSGAGTLTGNSYKSTATPELAVIGIMDSKGNTGSVQVIVQPDAGSLAGAGAGAGAGGAIVNPFAGKTPAQISDRSCNLQSVANAVEIENGIYYEFCLIVARFPDQSEFQLWYNSIMSQAVKPDLLPTALFRSGILQQKYHIDQMTQQVYIIFMVNHLLFRMPTTEEGAQLMAVGQSGGQEGIYNAILTSPAFGQANPLIPALKQKYQ